MLPFKTWGSRPIVSRFSSLRQTLLYCMASSMPMLLMALVFAWPLLFTNHYFPGTDLSILGYVMHAEFLAVASGILVVLPLLFPVATRVGRFVRMAAFMVIGYCFAWLAYNVDGTSGMLFYALLVFLTFGGGMLLVFDWLNYVTRAFLSLLRWSVAIFAYVSFQLYFDLDVDIEVWKNTRDVLPFGAIFFFTLSLCEVLLYPILTYYLENNVKYEKEQEELLIAESTGMQK